MQKHYKLLIGLMAIYLYFFPAALTAQTGWQRFFPAANPGSAVTTQMLAELPDGGFLVVGAGNFVHDENYEFRTNRYGQPLWLHNDSIITFPEVMHPRDAVITPEGAVQLWIYAPDPGWDKDFRFYGFNSDGRLQWNKQFFRDYDQTPASICRDGAGNLMVTGKDKWYNTPEKPFLFKADSAGNALWFRVLELPFPWIANHVENTRDNTGYLVSGIRSQGSDNGVVAKIDADSNLLWWRELPGATGIIYNGWNITTRANGELFLVTNGVAGPSQNQVRIIRLSADGDSLSTTYTALENGFEYNIETSEFDLEGNLYVCGSYYAPPFPTNIQGKMICKLTPEGELLWIRNLFNGFGSSAPNIIALRDGCMAYVTDYNNLLPDKRGILLIKICPDGSTFPATINGNILMAGDLDCIPDSLDIPRPGALVTLEGTIFGTSILTTDINGGFSASVDTGQYVLNAVPIGPYWEVCDSAVVIDIVLPDTAVYQDFIFNKVADCPFLTVDIATPFLKFCAPNTYAVLYGNTGTVAAENAYIDIRFDAGLIVQTASVPFSNLGGNVYRFPLGHIEAAQSGTFKVTTTMDCDSVSIGQTLCATAHIYPDSLCLPVNGLWSGASLEISAACAGDSVQFNIKNAGIGNMPAVQNFVVIEDIAILKTVPFILNAGSEIKISAHANGNFLRGETMQVPFHPGMSMPVAWVEGCNGMLIPGIVNQFPLDDADDFVETDCHEVEGIVGETEKSAAPEGIGTEHLLAQNIDLEYVIQFQNTGSDTVYTVTVRDSLPSQTDWLSIQPGASSHPYTFNLYSGGVVEFMFPNIKLPPQVDNLPGSYGFVKFRISQKPGLEDGTLIENDAQVFFDFNQPLTTNTTFHTIGKLVEPPVGNTEPENPALTDLWILPNPANSVVHISMGGKVANYGMEVVISRVTGEVVSVHAIREGSGGVTLLTEHLTSGVYLCRMTQNGRTLRSEKLVIMR